MFITSGLTGHSSTLAIGNQYIRHLYIDPKGVNN
jgi:hypothetical protein